MVAPLISIALLALACAGCDEQRKQECDALLSTMKPLDVGTPTSATVDSVAAKIDAMKLQDQSLAIYAKNYRATLTILSNTLKLKEGGSAPDGTDAVVQKNLKDARTDREDAARLCSK
jgi:hypothetical protein